MNIRRQADISGLPTAAFGHWTPQWWGLAMMIAIEGTLFGLCIGAYFYLRLQVPAWPPRPFPMPDWGPGIVNFVLIFAGAAVARLVERYALRLDAAKVLRDLAVFLVLNAAAVFVRILEFRAFHVKWDSNAYGSIVWLTLFFHSLHLFTTFGENAVLFAYVRFHGLDEKRALDLELNRVYWDFIVGSWIVLYAVLYFGPRLLN